MTPPATPTSAPPDAREIWCGIPVYNNAATIVDVATRCRAQLPNVVVVDDGSTDADLRELLRPLGVSVVRHATNLGKGAALLTAFRYAADRGGRYIVTLDGDAQHFPEDIPRFIPHLDPGTILIGSRQEVSGTMPRSSLFGREFSDFWICVETGREVSDTQSGFRVYPLQHVLELRLESRHYNFEMEVITRGLWAGLRAQSLPIRVWYPSVAERVSSFHPFRDNLRIARLHTRLVARQLLPVSHRRVLTEHGRLRLGTGSAGRATPAPTSALGRLCAENATPLGLAAAVALGVLLCIALWPYGVVLLAYLVVRLHLNKIAALVGLALALAPALSGVGAKVGHWLMPGDASPRLAWFVGSHAVALPLSAAMALVVYGVASRFQKSRAAE